MTSSSGGGGGGEEVLLFHPDLYRHRRNNTNSYVPFTWKFAKQQPTLTFHNSATISDMVMISVWAFDSPSCLTLLYGAFWNQTRWQKMNRSSKIDLFCLYDGLYIRLNI